MVRSLAIAAIPSAIAWTAGFNFDRGQGLAGLTMLTLIVWFWAWFVGQDF